ncbi:hypothetical protein AC578_250 [Pseudocercospora eumusae]|uniref:DUF541 domain-containing protein n=1 Tax=Pseudocercospora eumusae TaxID=321146 RepID=A0A139HIN5_9PEZI|nr:hypothetical protein AC578_250 [Pseudocercospora eumusae]
MTSTTTPFSLKVEGNAEIPLPADRAIIKVLVESEGSNKAAVSDEALTAAKHLEKILREMSLSEACPLAHWSKTSLSATSHRPRNDEGQLQPRQYNSSVSFDIRFKEFKALGAFAGRISSVSNVEINHIEWVLTAETQALHRSRLRKMAAGDAMQIARDYCDALGCGSPRPVNLEVDSYGSRGNKYYMASQELPGVGGGGDDEGSVVIEFTPQEVKMDLIVEVTFHAE